MHHQTSSQLRLRPQPNSDISPRSVVLKGALPTHRNPHQRITQPHHDQPSNLSSRHTGRRTRHITTTIDPHHNNHQPSTTHVSISIPRTRTPQWAPTQPTSNTATSSNQSYPHTIIPRPYVPAPRPHDAEGHPWCACCTAQLSDDDLHSHGLRNPANPHIRYQLRRDEDLPPTHSNLHNDLTRIHRTNADYHRSHREIEEAQQVITGNLPDYRPTTSYTKTPAATNIKRTTQHFQFKRYQRRGGLPPRLHVQQPQHH